ncbi:hypothetical protein B0H63DRAFT_504222 [Podospora didyma]|uniref:Uncharacterized protein n=1 Tax=Podospora didyma TaxID=330526 RepID=A0AAE0K238_9PEZI|nr:hypothetical protein B0H63DRAFT_504222 [Podospora didyma]
MLGMQELNEVEVSISGWVPWLGIASLISIFVCAMSSAIIVAASHDKDVETWPIQPAVWLAIFSGVSNVAYSSALATGIAVRFWLRAAQGTQLSQLHYIWEHGQGLGLLPALRAGSEARRVTLLATAAYILQFSSGPLLQRSTRQASQDRVSQQPMFLNLATRIPDGWFGNKQGRSVVGNRRAMSQVQGWYRNDSITTADEPGYRCNDANCHGYVRGAGFTYNCTSSTGALDLSKRSAQGSTVFLIQSRLVDNKTTSSPTLRLRVEYINSLEGNCQATVQKETCDITAAVVEYPVTIQGATVTLRHDELNTMRLISAYESAGDSLKAPDGVGVGPLSGLSDFIDDYFDKNATVKWYKDGSKWLYSGEGVGDLADIFFVAEPWTYGNHSLTSCGMTWNRPTQYVLEQLYEYMFRVALRVGRDTERQAFTVDRTVTVLVFRTETRFLGAAVVLIACGLGLVGSLSWGWWRLKRPVSMSPLETAKALGSPVFQDVAAPDASIDQILSGVRGVEIYTKDQLTAAERAMPRPPPIFVLPGNSNR